MVPDSAEIAAFLSAYVATWNSGRPSELANYWDRELTNPVYIAEEEEDVLIGWHAIEVYWAKLDGVGIAVEIGAAQLTPLSEDMVGAIYPMRWRLSLPGHPHWTRPIAGRVRTSVILRRLPAGWKIVHYVEAPFAAALQVKLWLEEGAEDWPGDVKG